MGSQPSRLPSKRNGIAPALPAAGPRLTGGGHEHSDIDLAAEGLPPGSAPFRAAAELDDLARPFAVDLVPLEDARPEMRTRIHQRGELLYDRDQT